MIVSNDFIRYILLSKQSNLVLKVSKHEKFIPISVNSIELSFAGSVSLQVAATVSEIAGKTSHAGSSLLVT